MVSRRAKERIVVLVSVGANSRRALNSHEEREKKIRGIRIIAFSDIYLTGTFFMSDIHVV